MWDNIYIYISICMSDQRRAVSPDFWNNSEREERLGLGWNILLWTTKIEFWGSIRLCQQISVRLYHSLFFYWVSKTTTIKWVFCSLTHIPIVLSLVHWCAPTNQKYIFRKQWTEFVNIGVESKIMFTELSTLMHYILISF